MNVTDWNVIVQLIQSYKFGIKKTTKGKLRSELLSFIDKLTADFEDLREMEGENNAKQYESNL